MKAKPRKYALFVVDLLRSTRRGNAASPVHASTPSPNAPRYPLASRPGEGTFLSPAAADAQRLPQRPSPSQQPGLLPVLLPVLPNRRRGQECPLSVRAANAHRCRAACGDTREAHVRSPSAPRTRMNNEVAWKRGHPARCLNTASFKGAHASTRLSLSQASVSAPHASVAGWPSWPPAPRLGYRRHPGSSPTASAKRTRHALNTVVGLLQRPTSATPAHPNAPHHPTRPFLPKPHGRGLKHRDYAPSSPRSPAASANPAPHALTRATTSGVHVAWLKGAHASPK